MADTLKSLISEARDLIERSAQSKEHKKERRDHENRLRRAEKREVKHRANIAANGGHYTPDLSRSGLSYKGGKRWRRGDWKSELRDKSHQYDDHVGTDHKAMSKDAIRLRTQGIRASLDSHGWKQPNGPKLPKKQEK